MTCLFSRFTIKSCAACVFTVLLVVECHSQFAISVAYDQHDGSDYSIDDVATEFRDDPTMLELSAGYWYRLKQKRVEFLPQAYYGFSMDDFDFTTYGLRVQAMTYPLDFDGDCDCPTFSKENDLIEKGWHIGVIAGYGRMENGDAGDSWDLDILHAGVLTGLDIGITNLLTITPEVRLLYRDAISSDLLSWEPGVDILPALRLMLRFDEKNYGYKRRRRRR